jgi:hypothetical protein
MGMMGKLDGYDGQVGRVGRYKGVCHHDVVLGVKFSNRDGHIGEFGNEPGPISEFGDRDGAIRELGERMAGWAGMKVSIITTCCGH